MIATREHSHQGNASPECPEVITSPAHQSELNRKSSAIVLNRHRLKSVLLNLGFVARRDDFSTSGHAGLKAGGRQKCLPHKKAHIQSAAKPRCATSATERTWRALPEVCR